MSAAALETLRNIYGYHEFRGHQEAIIAAVLEGSDALVLMPTGGGKSICYQIPALLSSGTALVVSPLIALMRNQVTALRHLGVRAAYLNSSLEPQEKREVIGELLRGQLQLLYVSPERLFLEGFLDLFKERPPSLIAIDEAHCVSQWGHDFRPEYLQLGVLSEIFPKTPRIALTATADEMTQIEIRKQLRLEDAEVFRSGFDRPNIRYRVAQRHNAKMQLKRFISEEHSEDSGIVYCLSRRKVEAIASWLSQEGFHALPYHAGLSPTERARAEDAFLREDGVIIVATIAFGMGIDKPDVRFVAHLDLPKSMEAYYQETGRAGRDGLPSDAWMIYGLNDVLTLKGMIEASLAEKQHKMLEHRRLNSLLGFCESTVCRRQVLLNYFGDNFSGPCNNCDVCLDGVPQFDGTIAAQKALSAVYRTGQRFGVSYLIKVLRGESDERIARLGHDRLPTFGIGADIPAADWHSIFRQLIASDLLAVTASEYASLLLTTKSAPVLKGESKVMLRREGKLSSPRAKIAKKISLEQYSTPASTEENKKLLRRLRELRTAIANELKLPPYMIFHDKTLLEIVEKRPKVLEDLRNISGIGERKLVSFGNAVLEVVGD